MNRIIGKGTGSTTIILPRFPGKIGSGGTEGPGATFSGVRNPLLTHFRPIAHTGAFQGLSRGLPKGFWLPKFTLFNLLRPYNPTTRTTPTYLGQKPKGILDPVAGRAFPRFPGPGDAPPLPGGVRGVPGTLHVHFGLLGVGQPPIVGFTPRLTNWTLPTPPDTIFILPEFLRPTSRHSGASLRA